MVNKKTEIYSLPSGAEIEIETLSERKAGASDVSFKSEDGKLLFEKVIDPLGEVSDLLLSKIKSSVHQPDTVTLEFAASLKGQTRLLIVSGEGQGSFKVTLTWKKSEAK